MSPDQKASPSLLVCGHLSVLGLDVLGGDGQPGPAGQSALHGAGPVLLLPHLDTEQVLPVTNSFATSRRQKYPVPFVFHVLIGEASCLLSRLLLFVLL